MYNFQRDQLLDIFYKDKKFTPRVIRVLDSNREYYQTYTLVQSHLYRTNPPPDIEYSFMIKPFANLKTIKVENIIDQILDLGLYRIDVNDSGTDAYVKFYINI